MRLRPDALSAVVEAAEATFPRAPSSRLRTVLYHVISPCILVEFDQNSTHLQLFAREPPLES